MKFIIEIMQWCECWNLEENIYFTADFYSFTFCRRSS